MDKKLLLMELPSFISGIFLGLLLIPSYNYSIISILILVIFTLILYSLLTMAVMFYLQKQKAIISEKKEKCINIPKENLKLISIKSFRVSHAFIIKGAWVYSDTILELIDRGDIYHIDKLDAALSKKRVENLIELDYLEPL
jgi:hypothetical protein